uniref:Uncharacterized protein n=1 Tax=Varanus komodoensis TaxID=61221 RepID=A0A8D2KX45_VARKO
WFHWASVGAGACAWAGEALLSALPGFWSPRVSRRARASKVARHCLPRLARILRQGSGGRCSPLWQGFGWTAVVGGAAHHFTSGPVAPRVGASAPRPALGCGLCFPCAGRWGWPQDGGACWWAWCP